MTPQDVRDTLKDVDTFIDSGSIDGAAVSAQIDRLTSLLEAVNNIEYDEKTSSTYGLLGAGIINRRMSLKSRLDAIEAGDYE